MKIVIDIPDGCYDELCNAQFPVQDAYRLVAWIKDGIPLPKWHGRLIGADKVYDDYQNANYDFEEALEYAPTIIPAEEMGE